METTKYALITGAGKGLGKAISLELASRHKNLLLLALSGERLPDFCQSIREQYNVDVQCFEIDFLLPGALLKIENWVRKFEINILVNNAGIGGSNYFEDSELTYIDAIIQINVRVLTLMTRILVPKLKKHKAAYILNVASMASYSPIAYKTVYPASKAFVYSFSRSLSEELKGSGVDVCVLLPGPIKTNSEVIRRIDQQGWWVQVGLQSPSELASIAVQKMFDHQKVVIPGWVNKINWILLKIIPASIRIPLISNAVKSEIAQCIPA